MKTKDALGNKIIFGNLYGFSTSSNGFSRVTIGEAVKLNPSRSVQVRPIFKRESLYMNDPYNVKLPKSVNIKPLMLFPVDNNFKGDKL